MLPLLAFCVPRSARADIRPDCSRPERSPDPIPAWSRLQWSVGAGIATASQPHLEWDTSFVVAPQAGFAVWAKEWRWIPVFMVFALVVWLQRRRLPRG